MLYHDPDQGGCGEYVLDVEVDDPSEYPDPSALVSLDGCPRCGNAFRKHHFRLRNWKEGQL